jgi:DNA-binding transcriptional ArsR family regulator
VTTGTPSANAVAPVRDGSIDSVRRRFLVSPRFEPFYALHGLMAGGDVHAAWRDWAAKRRSVRFERAAAPFNAAPAVWLAAADVMESRDFDADFDGVLRALEALPPKTFARRMLVSLMHFGDAADEILAGRPLAESLAALPAKKREWLAHVGLYPPNPGAPMVKALQAFAESPQGAKAATLEAITAFWDDSFAETWDRLMPQFDASVAARPREIEASGLVEFAKAFSLRIEIDSRRREIRALRGGYRLKFDEIAEVRLYPSAFNDRRYWSVLPNRRGHEVAHFPYFEPLADPSARANSRHRHAISAKRPRPPLDPALIFRALGDTTRYAMAELLARRPMTSVELARTLGVSPPTVSHHIHLLREAGLLLERRGSDGVSIELDRTTVEAVSSLAAAHLFDSGAPPRLRRSRSSR